MWKRLQSYAHDKPFSPTAIINRFLLFCAAENPLNPTLSGAKGDLTLFNPIIFSHVSVAHRATSARMSPETTPSSSGSDSSNNKPVKNADERLMVAVRIRPLKSDEPQRVLYAVNKKVRDTWKEF